MYVCHVYNVCHVMSYPVLPCHVVVCASTQQCYFVVNDSMFWLSLQTYLASVGGDPAARSHKVEQFTAL